MNAKTVLVVLLVVLALFAWGASAPTSTDPGTVSVRQDTYCPPTAADWADWRWRDDANKIRCGWDIETPNFLEADPTY